MKIPESDFSLSGIFLYWLVIYYNTLLGQGGNILDLCAIHVDLDQQRTISQRLYGRYLLIVVHLYKIKMLKAFELVQLGDGVTGTVNGN